MKKGLLVLFILIGLFSWASANPKIDIPEEAVRCFSGSLIMNKMIAVTAGTALTLALGAVTAKPLALVGLGSLVLAVWSATFDETLAADLFPEDTELNAAH